MSLREAMGRGVCSVTPAYRVQLNTPPSAPGGLQETQSPNMR